MEGGQLLLVLVRGTVPRVTQISANLVCTLSSDVTGVLWSYGLKYARVVPLDIDDRDPILNSFNNHRRSGWAYVNGDARAVRIVV